MTDYCGCTYVEMVIKTVALLHVHIHYLPHILNVSDPSFTPFNWRLVWINLCSLADSNVNYANFHNILYMYACAKKR